MRGRKPKPAAIKDQLAPVRSKRRKPEAEPAVLVSGVAPPKSVKGLALDVWNKLAPTLLSLRLLTVADVPAFARYCRLSSRYEEAEKALDKDGLTYESISAHGTLKRAHPAAMLSMRYSRELLALETQFGLLPGERQRIMQQRAQTGVGGGLDFGDPKAQGSTPAPAESPPLAPTKVPVTGFLGRAH